MTMRSLPPRPGGDLPHRTTFVTHVSSRPVAPVMPPRTVIDNAVYIDGRRIATPTSTSETCRLLQEHPRSMGWIGLFQPEPSDLEAIGEEFGLHELALEDAIMAHQRSKIERYDDTLFLVLRAVRYLDGPEEIELGELHVFMGPRYIITVRHGGSPDLSRVRRRLESDPDMLGQGPEGVLYAILDAVVDGYAPVLAGLANDIDEIEDEVFSGNTEVSRRVYELSQEVVEFQRAVKPLRAILAGLTAGSVKYQVGEELQEYLR
ncbi:MAG TPA: magnesium and cobalt transport protein CorA, partial [Propionibacteriaceae bacterium]|nr:magnesium and cobalt transport protein CorA [Propionibacteriaceae bacterium]